MQCQARASIMKALNETRDTELPNHVICKVDSANPPYYTRIGFPNYELSNWVPIVLRKQTLISQ